MKKIILIFFSILLLLFSCWYEKNNKNFKEEKISEEVKVVAKKNKNKDFKIIEDEEYSWWKENKFLLVDNFSDDKYKKFSKYKSLNWLHLTINNFIWKKWINKTLSYIKNNFFKNKWEHDFSIEDYPYYFTNIEYNIISKINISEFYIIWKYPDINLPNPTKNEILSYKKEVALFDKNMKDILNNSKTLKKITVLDYKIFKKENWKIEIEDIRMNKWLINTWIKN